MTNKTLNTWGARLAHGLLLRLLIAAIVLPLGCACVLIPLYIAQNGDFDDTTTFLILAVPTGGFILLIFGGAIGIGAWMLLSRKRQLDDAFGPLGLTGSMHMLSGRQYHGIWQGRQVDAYFYRGPTLELYLNAPLKTRLALGTRDSLGSAIGGLMNRQPMQLDDPDFNRLSIFPLDETWSRALLADPTAKAAVLRLTADQGPFELRQFYVQPEALRLSVYHTEQSRITAENVRQWLNDLLAVARIAESLPPPRQAAEASPMEHDARANRNKMTRLGYAIGCGIVAVISACAIGMGGIALWAAGQGR